MASNSTSTSSSNVYTNMKIRIISPPTYRNGLYRFDCINHLNQICSTSMPTENTLFQMDSCLQIKTFGFNIIKDGRNHLRLDDKTQVFKTKKFIIDETVLEAHLHSPRISIPDALASPAKRRISIEGEIIDVSPVKREKSWKRQDVGLQDSNNNKIKLKFWNRDDLEVSVGDCVIFENMETDIFNEKVTLNSTETTTLKKGDLDDIEAEFLYDGIQDQQDPYQLIATDGSVHEISEELFCERYTIEGFLNVVPVRIPVTLKGKQIIAIR